MGPGKNQRNTTGRMHFLLRVAATTSISGGETSVLRARVISRPPGKKGQYIYISPQNKVVIVFTGSIMGFPLGVGYAYQLADNFVRRPNKLLP
jgi:hypothetical protein